MAVNGRCFTKLFYGLAVELTDCKTQYTPLKGKWAVIHCCRRCGPLSSNHVADDNPMKLMSIAVKPLSLPPFPLEPLERIEEMT